MAADVVALYRQTNIDLVHGTQFCYPGGWVRAALLVRSVCAHACNVHVCVHMHVGVLAPLMQWLVLPPSSRMLMSCFWAAFGLAAVGMNHPGVSKQRLY